MQFLFLLLLNICMWALFYLIISLKLEKSASHFREQKLHNEMDEIIKEFNAVAERNISMLDTRIQAMKRLMELGGDIRTVDMVLDDDANVSSGKAVSADVVPDQVREEVVKTQGYEYPGLRTMLVDFFKKGLLLTVERLNILIYGSKQAGDTKSTAGMTCAENISDKPPIPCEVTMPVNASREMIIEPEIEQTVGMDGDRWEDLPGEKELKRMFDESEDKYSLVGDLYRKGYSIETLSRHSGLPTGEIKLVLNLSRPV